MTISWCVAGGNWRAWQWLRPHCDDELMCCRRQLARVAVAEAFCDDELMCCRRQLARVAVAEAFCDDELMCCRRQLARVAVAEASL